MDSYILVEDRRNNKENESMSDIDLSGSKRNQVGIRKRVLEKVRFEQKLKEMRGGARYRAEKCSMQRDS